MQVAKSSRRYNIIYIYKVFKAINHLASLFLPRERGHVPTTSKRPVGRPRKRKPSAGLSSTSAKHRLCKQDLTEPQRRCRSRSQADSMSIHDEAEDAHRNVLSASPIKHAVHVLISAPQYRHPLDLYIIVSALILGTLWPWNYFLAAPILEIIRYHKPISNHLSDSLSCMPTYQLAHSIHGIT